MDALAQNQVGALQVTYAVGDYFIWGVIASAFDVAGGSRLETIDEI
jgi:hypothetical protein